MFLLRHGGTSSFDREGSPASTNPDTPDNYQHVAWDLAEDDGGTVLTITERNVPSDEAAKTSEQAWKHALGSLKDMLER